MQEEVEKLQEDLGIPKDDDLNDLDYGLGCGSSYDNLSDLDYGMQCDNLSNHENRLGSCTELQFTSDLIDSVDQLTINSPIKAESTIETDNWLYTNDVFDNLRLPLKLPVRDNDNDSSIGCELLSDSSENGIVSVNDNDSAAR